jgi:putative DNA primase/helicase
MTSNHQRSFGMKPRAKMMVAALRLAKQGYYVFPLRPRTKIPFAGGPTFKDATNDPVVVRKYWTQYPNANIGLVPGRSGNMVLDIDGPDGEAQAKALRLYDVKTLIIITGRPDGGRHLMFLHPGGQIGNKDLASKINVRADNGYVVAPPSVHPSGAIYKYQDPNVRPAALPEHIRRLLIGGAGRNTEKVGQNTSNTHPKSQLVQEGGRNNKLTSIAGALRRQGANESAVYTALSQLNTEMCDPPLSDTEVQSIARSVARYPVAEQPQTLLPFTDVGNAARFVRYFGDDFRYVNGLGWMVWNGSRWERDDCNAVENFAKTISEHILREILP